MGSAAAAAAQVPQHHHGASDRDHRQRWRQPSQRRAMTRAGGQATTSPGETAVAQTWPLGWTQAQRLLVPPHHHARCFLQWCGGCHRAAGAHEQHTSAVTGQQAQLHKHATGNTPPPPLPATALRVTGQGIHTALHYTALYTTLHSITLHCTTNARYCTTLHGTYLSGAGASEHRCGWPCAPADCAAYPRVHAGICGQARLQRPHHCRYLAAWWAVTARSQEATALAGRLRSAAQRRAVCCALRGGTDRPALLHHLVPSPARAARLKRQQLHHGSHVHHRAATATAAAAQSHPC